MATKRKRPLAVKKTAEQIALEKLPVKVKYQVRWHRQTIDGIFHLKMDFQDAQYARNFYERLHRPGLYYRELIDCKDDTVLAQDGEPTSESRGEYQDAQMALGDFLVL